MILMRLQLIKYNIRLMINNIMKSYLLKRTLMNKDYSLIFNVMDMIERKLMITNFSRLEAECYVGEMLKIRNSIHKYDPEFLNNEDFINKWESIFSYFK